MSEKLIKLAREWVKKHDEGGQKRWGGDPYSTHPNEVANIAGLMIYDDIIKVYNTIDTIDSEFKDTITVVALLHDIWEDRKYTNITLDELKEAFGDEITTAVLILSKEKGDSYFDFIVRVANSDNIFAIIVKMADLKHNLSDAKPGSLKDKYKFALNYLERVL
jgi:(p)ppGpp synthase/HD superfamily hydrolase